MYKKSLVRVGAGTLCQASLQANGTVVLVRENGRIVRRTVLSSGKAIAARAVSYAQARFECPFAVLEIVGEEVLYEPTGTNT